MGRKLTIHLEHDPDLENPSENGDGQWQLYSFSTRHLRYKHPDKFNNIGMRRKLQVGLAFMLSYYEHSLCLWSLAGEGPKCPWDSVAHAGILVWEEAPSNMGAKTHVARSEDARAFLETYTQWCNGECYSYAIEYEGEIIDSCCGFYGGDHLFNTIAESIEPGDEVKYAGDCADLAIYHSNPVDERAKLALYDH